MAEPSASRSSAQHSPRVRAERTRGGSFDPPRRCYRFSRVGAVHAFLDVDAGHVIAATVTPALARPIPVVSHPGVELRANLESISHRCHLEEVESVWESTEDTIYLPLGCLQGGLCLTRIG